MYNYKKAQERSWFHFLNPGQIGRGIAEGLFDEYSARMYLLRDVDKGLRDIALGSNSYGLRLSSGWAAGNLVPSSGQDLQSEMNKALKESRYIDALASAGKITKVIYELIKYGREEVRVLENVGLEYQARGDNPESVGILKEDPLSLDELEDKDLDKQAQFGGVGRFIYRGLVGDPIENTYRQQMVANKRKVELVVRAANNSITRIISSFNSMGYATTSGNIGKWLKEFQNIEVVFNRLKNVYDKTLNDPMVQKLIDVASDPKTPQTSSAKKLKNEREEKKRKEKEENDTKKTKVENKKVSSLWRQIKEYLKDRFSVTEEQIDDNPQVQLSWTDLKPEDITDDIWDAQMKKMQETFDLANIENLERFKDWLKNRVETGIHTPWETSSGQTPPEQTPPEQTPPEQTPPEQTPSEQTPSEQTAEEVDPLHELRRLMLGADRAQRDIAQTSEQTAEEVDPLSDTVPSSGLNSNTDKDKKDRNIRPLARDSQGNPIPDEDFFDVLKKIRDASIIEEPDKNNKIIVKDEIGDIKATIDVDKDEIIFDDMFFKTKDGLKKIFPTSFLDKIFEKFIFNHNLLPSKSKSTSNVGNRVIREEVEKPPIAVLVVGSKAKIKAKKYKEIKEGLERRYGFPVVFVKQNNLSKDLKSISSTYNVKDIFKISLQNKQGKINLIVTKEDPNPVIDTEGDNVSTRTVRTPPPVQDPGEAPVLTPSNTNKPVVLIYPGDNFTKRMATIIIDVYKSNITDPEELNRKYSVSSKNQAEREMRDPEIKQRYEYREIPEDVLSTATKQLRRRAENYVNNMLKTASNKGEAALILISCSKKLEDYTPDFSDKLLKTARDILDE